MKIFICNRNLITWPKAMAELLANQGHEIIFADCGSTYGPLIDWYETDCPFKVHRLPNLGGNAIFDAGLIPDNEFFVQTDPDYDLSKVPADWPEVLMEGFERYPQHYKMGLSWDDTIVPHENPAYKQDKVWKHIHGDPFDKKIPG